MHFCPGSLHELHFLVAFLSLPSAALCLSLHACFSVLLLLFSSVNRPLCSIVCPPWSALSLCASHCTSPSLVHDYGLHACSFSVYLQQMLALVSRVSCSFRVLTCMRRPLVDECVPFAPLLVQPDCVLSLLHIIYMHTTYKLTSFSIKRISVLERPSLSPF